MSRSKPRRWIKIQRLKSLPSRSSREMVAKFGQIRIFGTCRCSILALGACSSEIRSSYWRIPSCRSRYHRLEVYPTFASSSTLLIVVLVRCRATATTTFDSADFNNMTSTFSRQGFRTKTLGGTFPPSFVFRYLGCLHGSTSSRNFTEISVLPVSSKNFTHEKRFGGNGRSNDFIDVIFYWACRYVRAWVTSTVALEVPTEKSRHLMFRLAIISFIALRVIACPVFCAVGGEVSGVEKVGCCHCGHEDSTPFNGEKSPSNNDPCPCDAGCVCQVTPDQNNRSVADTFSIALDLSPLPVETLNLSEILGKRCVERHPQRFDLQSGRDVRLVYASLLL